MCRFFSKWASALVSIVAVSALVVVTPGAVEAKQHIAVCISGDPGDGLDSTSSGGGYGDPTDGEGGDPTDGNGRESQGGIKVVDAPNYAEAGDPGDGEEIAVQADPNVSVSNGWVNLVQAIYYNWTRFAR